MLKYLKFAPYLLLVAFFFLWQSEKKDNKILNANNSSLRNDSISLTADLKSTKDFANKLQKAKTKVDTLTRTIKGSTKIVYDTVFIASVTVSTIDSTKDVKTLKDGLKTKELDLEYIIKYSGDIFDIDFTWNVKEQVIMKDHIIFEDVYVDKIVYKERSYYYASYYYGSSLHDINFGYISKSKIGFGCGVTIFNGKTYPKIGVSILF